MHCSDVIDPRGVELFGAAFLHLADGPEALFLSERSLLAPPISLADGPEALSPGPAIFTIARTDGGFAGLADCKIDLDNGYARHMVAYCCQWPIAFVSHFGAFVRRINLQTGRVDRFPLPHDVMGGPAPHHLTPTMLRVAEDPHSIVPGGSIICAFRTSDDDSITVRRLRLPCGADEIFRHVFRRFDVDRYGAADQHLLPDIWRIVAEYCTPTTVSEMMHGVVVSHPTRAVPILSGLPSGQILIGLSAPRRVYARVALIDPSSGSFSKLNDAICLELPAFTVPVAVDPSRQCVYVVSLHQLIIRIPLPSTAFARPPPPLLDW